MTTYTEATWHVTTGCSPVSATCNSCLIDDEISKEVSFNKLFQNNTTPTFHESTLTFPLNWTTSRLVTVSPLSDLFNINFTSDQITSVFEIIKQTPQHIYMLSTKSPHRAAAASKLLGWPDNLWIGTSIEGNEYLNRINHMREIPAIIKYVEFLPLLGPIDNIIKDYDIGCLDFITFGADVKRKQSFNPEWITPITNPNNGFTDIPLVYKAEPLSFPTATMNLLFYDIEIDATRQPTTWTITNSLT